MSKKKKVLGSLLAVAIVAGLSYAFRDKLPKRRKKRDYKTPMEHAR